MAFKLFLLHVEREKPGCHLYTCRWQQGELLPEDSNVHFTKKELELDNGPKREQPGVVLVGETKYGRMN